MDKSQPPPQIPPACSCIIIASQLHQMTRKPNGNDNLATPTDLLTVSIYSTNAFWHKGVHVLLFVPATLSQREDLKHTVYLTVIDKCSSPTTPKP